MRVLYNEMTRESSIYLDMLRFVSALMVYASHLGSRAIGGGILWPFNMFGTPAVTVFFVLSGFVIGYVTDAHETNGYDYLVSRAARLYSVVIPTLILTSLLDSIGSSVNPAMYESFHGAAQMSVWRLIASGVFLNEIWGSSIIPGTNGAYWSLGYEIAYYAL